MNIKWLSIFNLNYLKTDTSAYWFNKYVAFYELE